MRRGGRLVAALLITVWAVCSPLYGAMGPVAGSADVQKASTSVRHCCCLDGTTAGPVHPTANWSRWPNSIARSTDPAIRVPASTILAGVESGDYAVMGASGQVSPAE